MAGGNQGHVTQVEYTHGYYAELSPVRAKLALAYAGLRSLNFTTACELGFGQGISIALHEAAQPIEWWGTDFNPQHAAAARTLSSAPRADTRLDEAGFAEFCTRPDLPDLTLSGFMVLACPRCLIQFQCQCMAFADAVVGVGEVQKGLEPANWKAMKMVFPCVREIRVATAA